MDSQKTDQSVSSAASNGSAQRSRQVSKPTRSLYSDLKGPPPHRFKDDEPLHWTLRDEQWWEYYRKTSGVEDTIEIFKAYYEDKYHVDLEYKSPCGAHSADTAARSESTCSAHNSTVPNTGAGGADDSRHQWLKPESTEGQPTTAKKQDEPQGSSHASSGTLGRKRVHFVDESPPGGTKRRSTGNSSGAT